MKDVRFYIEYYSPQDKRKDKRSGNVVAVFPNDPANPGRVNALSAIFYQPNSATSYSEVDWEWLRTNCKRVSEAEARAEGHSLLFERLDAWMRGIEQCERLEKLVQVTPDCVGVRFRNAQAEDGFFCTTCVRTYDIGGYADAPETVKTQFTPLRRNSGLSFMRRCDQCGAWLDTYDTPAAHIAL